MKTSSVSRVFRLSAFMLVLLTHQHSYAFVEVPPPSIDVQNEKADSNSEYYLALGKFERMDAEGHRASLVSAAFFKSLGWIGRTACVNYVCSTLAIDQCRRVLGFALADEALVVRDHALRIFIASQKFSDVEKVNAAERSINDPRNFRKGRPFWIVERAKGFLSARKEGSLRD